MYIIKYLLVKINYWLNFLVLIFVFENLKKECVFNEKCIY